jgi:acylphosphatase
VIRRRVLVKGYVQGVGFRYSVRERARQRGVSGWVSNRDDGSVEAVLEGEDDSVEALVAFMRRGPRGADVGGVDVTGEEPEGLRGFDVR